MIDFVKIVIYSKLIAEHIRKSKVWVGYLDKGKIYYRWKDFIALPHPSGRIEIRGSLHICMQNHNWGDFTRLDLWDTIYEVCQVLGTDAPEQIKLANIEFGVNIKVDFDPSQFLKDVIQYKGGPFKQVKTRERLTGSGIEAIKEKWYSVKIYDKGRKPELPHYLLRFEVHVFKMAYLKSLMINSLADLLMENKLKALGNLLLEVWEHVTIAVPLDLSNLSKPERKQYEQATNPRHWTKLNRKQRYDLKRKYEALIEKYAEENCKKVIGQMLSDQWEYLMQISKTGYVFTDPKKGRFHHLGKELKRNQEMYCLITGFKISGQKEGSKFVGENTVRENPELAEKLDEGRRSNSRKHTDISENARRAKRPRNQWSNPANNTRKSIQNLMNKGNLLLFPLDETISPQKLALIERFKGTEWEVRISQNS